VSDICFTFTEALFLQLPAFIPFDLHSHFLTGFEESECRNPDIIFPLGIL